MMALGRCGRLAVALVLLGCSGPPATAAPAAPAQAPAPRAPALPDEAPRGDLPRDVIQSTIRTRLAEVQSCYQKRLLRRPELTGKVVVVFRIAADGHVEHASAAGIDDAPLTDCIAGVLLTLRFPPPSGGGFVNVSYPFTLRRTDDLPR